MTTTWRSTTIARLAVLALLGLLTAGLITSCGSAAKPAYCTDVTNFKNAVGKLTDSGSPSAIVSNVTNVISSGQKALTAVKTNFAPQTTALKSSLTALANSATQLLSSGTRAAALQAIPGQVTAVKSAATSLSDAAHPKCS